MEQIKKYIDEIVKEGKKFNSEEFRNKIQADYMHSGIKFFINDSVAPFAFADKKNSLRKILASRCQEGANGQVAVDKYIDKEKYYDINRNNFDGLNYAYYYGMQFPQQFKDREEKDKILKVFGSFKSILTGEGQSKKIGNGFERVGDVSKTFNLFKKATVGLDEVDENGIFKVSLGVGNSVDRSFNMREFLIEENLSQFDKVCKVKNFDEKNAICSIATILLLRAIAQEGEEERIDNLAEELIPFISFALDKVQENAMSDDTLYSEALKLACDRLEKLNEGLDKQVYTSSLKNLRQDAKIYQEMRKTIDDQYFKDYNINFSHVGVNKPFSFVNKDGHFEECKIKDKKIEAFRFLDNNIILTDSVCDTDDEVLATMFGNLFMLTSSKDEGTIARNNLVEAFALPLIQAANKLGDEKANVIIKEAIARYNDELKKDKKGIIKNVLDPLEVEAFEIQEIKNEPFVAQEVSTPIVEDYTSDEMTSDEIQITPKTSSINPKKVRKDAIKSFSKIICQVSRKKTFSLIDENGKNKKVHLTPVKRETLRNVLGFMQEIRLVKGEELTDIEAVSKYSEDALKITNNFAGEFLRDRVKTLEEISGGFDNEYTNEQKKVLTRAAKLSKKDIESFTKESVSKISDEKTK